MQKQYTFITVPKVSILHFCSGFRWTAVLESVQRNPLTNAVTLQSIPLSWRFLRSEFRCNALDSTIKYFKLAVDSSKPMTAVESTIGCSEPHCSVSVEFTEFFQYQPTKAINHQEEVEFMYFSA